MSEYNVTVVSNESKTEDEVIVCINDQYNGSEICEYVLPVSEVATPPYTFYKDVKPVEDSYYDVSYNL
jgi:hypothetical protein